MPATENPNRPRRAAWVAALLITIVAVGLHVRLLNHAGGLWRDEVNLVNLAGHSSLADFAHDAFPVLMPLTVHGWLQVGLGKTDFGLRCFGLLVGLAILAALWANSWTTRRAPPLIGLALFALNSLVIIYGDSLRGYGLGSALIVFAAAGAWAFLKNPTWLRAGIFAALAVLSVQALYQNAVLIGAICVGAFAVSWQRKTFSAALKIFLAGLLAAVSLLPYLPNLLAVPENAAGLRTGFQPDMIAQNLSLALGFPLSLYVFAWALLVVLVIFFGFAASNNEPQLFVAVTLLAALAGFGGFLWLAALPTQPWYFLPLMALVAACFDAGLPELPKNFWPASFGLVTATALVAAMFSWRDMELRFTNVDLIAHIVASRANQNDLVIVQPWYCGISFERYFKSTTPWTTLPPLADHSGHRYDLVHMQMQNTNALAPVFEQIAATMSSGHRVWIVGWLDVPAPDAKPSKPLPSPPLKYSGWSDTPYSIQWGAQVAMIIRDHCKNFGRAELPPFGAVNPNEQLHLLVADGWSSPTNSVAR
jgi:hypothetical protein